MLYLACFPQNIFLSLTTQDKVLKVVYLMLLDTQSRADITQEVVLYKPPLPSHIYIMESCFKT